MSEPARIPLERFFEQPPPGGRRLAEVRWRPGWECFSYVEQSAEQNGGGDLWVFDLSTGEKALLVCGKDVQYEGGPISLQGYRWFPDGERLLLSGRAGAFEYHPGERSIRRLTASLDERVCPVFSPEGTHLAFVRGNNLHVLDLASGGERALTTDGSETLLNGVLDWVYWEELGHRSRWRAFEWSPGGTRIAFLRLDQGRVPEYPLVDWMAVHPSVTWQRYPKAGDPNSIAGLRVVDVADGRLIAEHQEEADAFYLAPCLAWTPDGRGVAHARLSRDQRSLELRLLSADGAQTLLREKDPHWLNHIGPPVFLPDGDFLWLSERSGRAHLYRHAPTGELRHPITHGDWQVEKVHTRNGSHVYLTGTGEDPRERLLYRAALDGSGYERLTDAGGVHDALVRKDGTWAVIGRQTPERPRQARAVHFLSGASQPVGRVDAEWEQYAWPEALFPELAAEDGTPLFGRLLLPPDFDPKRRYPVVVHVYGGPHAQTVQKVWTGADPLEQILTRAGILCWRLDNRGSWGRGHAFETPVDRRLGEVELRDQLAGVEYLCSLPYVDGDRIGITGWSYGGYLTLYALMHAPQVWRCGAAGAPVTSWALYDSIYTERYLGTPADNPEGYRRSSPLEEAHAIQAPLLLAHGTDDDNVHLQHTLQLVEALSRHRKPYELVIQPKQKHGFKGKNAEVFLHERMLAFFRRHLHVED